VTVFAATALIDNAFSSIVSQQHDKRMGSSGVG
jgi:hypothetical protein